MLRLMLVRHAKSSWDDPSLGDFERPLNARGRRDAPRMARFLAAQGLVPQRLFSSPARRAMQTAQALAAAWPGLAIDIEPAFYEAGVGDWMRWLRDLDDRTQFVAAVGHNPGIADFASVLIGRDVGHVPTCAVIGIELELQHWRQAAPSCARLAFVHVPKALPD